MNKVFLFFPASKFMLALSQNKRSEPLIFNLKHFPVGFHRSPLRKESQSIDAHPGRGAYGPERAWRKALIPLLAGAPVSTAAHPTFTRGAQAWLPLAGMEDKAETAETLIESKEPEFTAYHNFQFPGNEIWLMNYG